MQVIWKIYICFFYYLPINRNTIVIVVFTKNEIYLILLLAQKYEDEYKNEYLLHVIPTNRPFFVSYAWTEYSSAVLPENSKIILA